MEVENNLVELKNYIMKKREKKRAKNKALQNIQIADRAEIKQTMLRMRIHKVMQLRQGKSEEEFEYSGHDVQVIDDNLQKLRFFREEYED